MNITRYPYDSLGVADHGWLQSHFHFSFAEYRNPDRVYFGKLRVINDDIIAPNTGFDTHPHEDMEIITYVRKGAITHRDSVGNVGRTEAGDVQVMSAGTGIRHSEHNREAEPTELYQIWIFPDKKGVQPRWEAKQFPNAWAKDALHLLVSGRSEDAEKGALFIYQDAAIFGGKMQADTRIDHPLKHQAYMLVSEGTVRMGDVELHAGDGAEVTDAKNLPIEASTDAEVLVIDVP